MKNYQYRITDGTKCMLSMPTEYSEDDCCFYPDNECASTSFMGEEVYFEAGNCCVTLPKVKVVELIKGEAEMYKELRREDRLMPILNIISAAQTAALLLHILTEGDK